MKNYWALFLVVLIISKSYGQDTVSKTIIIDSFVLSEGLPKDMCHEYMLLSKTGDSYVSFEHDYWDNIYRPALNCKAKFISGTDFAIGILIDDIGDVIELHHLERLGDTIHIPVYRIYKNCLLDSVTNGVSYYRHINDSLINPPYKTKYSKFVPASPCHDTLKDIVLTINGFYYDIPILISKAKTVQIYDGYPTKRDTKKSEKRKWDVSTKRNRKKIKYNSVCDSICFYRHTYSGQIDFSKAIPIKQ